MNTPIDPAYVEHCERRISELERQVIAEKERTDYAVRNLTITENARQEEMAKRDALTEQVAALTKENDRLKTVPMKYRRMEFNAQLQNQLAAAQAVNERLRGAIHAYLNSKSEYAKYTLIQSMLQEALALPNDDTALQQRLAKEREKMGEAIDRVLEDYSSNITRDAVREAIRSMK